jgi:hypothetical protein
MESRPSTLDIIHPIIVSGELEQNLIILKINTIIDFINKNRYRQQAEQGEKYQQGHPQASLSRDIQVRESIALNLKNENNIVEMINEVTASLKKKYKKERERQAQYDKFRDVADPFLRNVQFVHLTAAELAIVGMSIDTLLILLHKVRDNLTDDDALQIITKKQKEILKVREDVSKCMAYHQAVFNANMNKKDFYYSDIVYNLFETIERETGVELRSERNDLWPDMSYLEILPPLPFNKQAEPKKVADYFSEYQQTPAPGIEHINQLTDDIKNELLLLDEEEPLKVKQEPAPATSTGCFSGGFWSRPVVTPEVTSVAAVVKSNNLDDESSPAVATRHVEDKTMDDIIRLMKNFNEKAEQDLADLKLYDSFRAELIELQNDLKSEINQLKQPSCFSCFWAGSVTKKIAKQNAIEHVLSAGTLKELGRYAHDELNGPHKDLVLAGWFSRTEKLLKRIYNVAQFECEMALDYALM